MNENGLIKNNPFGLNMALSQKASEETVNIVKQSIEETAVNSVLNYSDENDRVFSGEVSQEIRKYQAQIYSLGQIMREGQILRTFNIKM